MTPAASYAIASGASTRTLLMRSPSAPPAHAYGPSLSERTKTLLLGELPPLFQIDRPDAQALAPLRHAMQQETAALRAQAADGWQTSCFALATADRALACLPAFRAQHPPAPAGGSVASAMRAGHRQALMDRFRACFAGQPAPAQYLLASAIAPAALSACGVELGRAMAELSAARRQAADQASALDSDDLLALFDAVNTPDSLTMINAALALDRYGISGPLNTLRPLTHACCSAIDKLHQHNDYRVALVQMDCGAVGADQNGVNPDWLAHALGLGMPVRLPLILGTSATAPFAHDKHATAHLVVEGSGADVSAFSEQALPARQVWLPLGTQLRVTGQWPTIAEEGLPARFIARAHEGEGSWYINEGLWPTMAPRTSGEVNDTTPIGPEHGVQSRAIGEGRFQDVVISPYDVRPNKYLFTVDARGINIVLERTATANPRGMVLHSNLSARALAAGEVWFLSEDTVQINNGSVRFGVRTPEQWDAVARLWQALGYRVRQVGFKRRFGPEETLDIKVLPPPDEL